MSGRLPLSAVTSLATLIATLAACGGGNDQRPSGGTPAATPVATATADGPGVITGTITFAGTPPRARPLRMDSDPRCAGDPEATYEMLVVGPENGLQNVFVYVKDGLGNRVYATPTTPVTLDQKGCRYIPHVFGVQVGQPVQISNSDRTLHNVNAAPKENQAFNFGQVPSTPAVTRTFDRAEIGIPIRCDVHSWMNAYAGVVPHPFFAITKADGTFEIKGLPPGTYTIEAWHETLGTRTQQVTIAAKESKDVAFTFAH
jgi:plastocyanin